MMDLETLRDIVQTTFLSLKIAGTATVLAFAVGGGLAGLLFGRRGRCATGVEFIISLPLVLPPTILGFYILSMIGRTGPLGQLISSTINVDIIFTPTAAVLAATAAAVPIMFKSIKTIFECVDPDVIEAARVDGASDFHILVFIRIPLAIKGVLTGTMLSFLRAIGEFGATFMVAGNIPGKTQTLSLAIWNSVMSGELVKAHIITALLAGLCLIFILCIRVIDAKFHVKELAV